MNFNFVDAIEGFLKSTAQETLLMKTLFELSERLRDAHLRLGKALDGNFGHDDGTNLHVAVQKAIPILNGVDFAFSRELERIKSDVAVMRADSLGWLQPELDVVVAGFEAALKTYNLDRKESNATHAIVAATTLLANLLKIREAAAALRKVLIDPLPHGQQEEGLQIVFDGKQDAAQVARSVSCLNSIYNAIAESMGINTTEYPLWITRVLVGSTRYEVVGAILAIPVVGKVIVETGRFLHRTYTREGQIDGVRLRGDLAKYVGGLVEDARRRGLATASMEATAEAVYETATANALELLKDEQCVRVAGDDVIIRDPIYYAALVEAQRVTALPSPKSGSPPQLPGAGADNATGPIS